MYELRATADQLGKLGELLIKAYQEGAWLTERETQKIHVQFEDSGDVTIWQRCDGFEALAHSVLVSERALQTLITEIDK